MFLDLFWNKELLGYAKFFILDVSCKRDDFHPITKRCRNGVQNVCRSDKYDIAQVERDFQVMVAEGIILLRVQRLQECGRWVATEAAPTLSISSDMKIGFL